MYTIQEVSQKLGISRSLCYREIRSGNLRAHRFARRAYRVRPEDLADYIDRSVQPVAGRNTAHPARRYTNGEHTAFQHVDVSRWLSSQS